MVIKPKVQTLTTLLQPVGYLSENRLKLAIVFMLMIQFQIFDISSADISLENVSPGLLFFDPPNSMTIYERQNIEAIISVDFNKSRVGKKPEKIPVREIMEVNLTGDPDVFSITSAYSSTQLISDSNDTAWVWRVTPKKIGLYDLTLTIIPINKSQPT